MQESGEGCLDAWDCRREREKTNMSPKASLCSRSVGAFVLCVLWSLPGQALGGAKPISVEDCRSLEWKGTPAAAPTVHVTPAGDKRPAIRLSSDGSGGEWTRALTLDVSKAESFAVRVAASEPLACTLSLASGKGRFERSFQVGPGEQVVLMDKATFEMKSGPTGWDRLDAVTLTLHKTVKPVTIDLLGIEALDDGMDPSGKEALLLQPAVTRVRTQGTAWPIYAIVSDIDYPNKLVPRFEKELAGYLKQLTGADIPVNPAWAKATPAVVNVLVLGRKAALKAGTVTQEELDRCGYQGFLIKANGPTPTIAGGSRHGTAFGAYAFLEKQGCRFYGRGIEKIPSGGSRTLKACELADKPFLDVKRYHGPYSIGGFDYSFVGHCRLAAEQAGEKDLFEAIWLEHTAGYIVPMSLYYDEHPEYFALLANGERVPKTKRVINTMICLTHPDVLKVSAERVIRWMELQPDRRYFCVVQGDAPEWCTCPACKAMEYEQGNHADQLLHWVNYVARAVAKRFPDNVIITLAYNGADTPPVKLRPEKNVIVLYAGWPALNVGSYLKDFDDPHNEIAYNHLKGWLKVAPENMGLFVYPGGSGYTLHGMAAQLKWAARHNMRGIWYCGGGEMPFAKLYAYVHSKIGWDPTLEVEPLTKEFVRAYYGPGAETVLELLDMIYGRMDSSRYDDRLNYAKYPPLDFFDEAFVTRVFALFDKSLDQTKALPGPNADLKAARRLFITNYLKAMSRRKAPLTDEQYPVLGRMLDEYVSTVWIPKNARAIAEAKKKGGAPVYKGLAKEIWDYTRVRVPESTPDGELPEIVRKLIAKPRETIAAHAVTDFVEEIPGGWRVPPQQFAGAQIFENYHWFCEPRTAVCIRGRMTEVSQARAVLDLKDDPPGRAAVLEVEGQDSDKQWCPPTPIEILVNGRKVFEGPNGFVKRGWSKRTWTLPAGTLHKGRNTITIRNLTSTDSMNSHWFMASDVRVTFPEADAPHKK